MHLRTVRSGKGIRGVEGLAEKEAHAVHTISIISHPQYFVSRCLICVDNVLPLRSICVFSFYPEASDVGKPTSSVLDTVQAIGSHIFHDYSRHKIIASYSYVNERREGKMERVCACTA